MLKNYFIAARRNATRDLFYVLINVIGLALGFGAAILVALFVRDELSYNQFLPGYEDVYRVQLTVREPDRPPVTFAPTPKQLAAELKLDFPEIVATTRYMHQTSAIRHEQVEANEMIEAVDPNYLTVIQAPMLRGDRATALEEPNTIVLTRAVAEKYFGSIECLGQTLEINHNPTRVTGIIENLPSNTTEQSNGLLSSKSTYSRISALDSTPAVVGELVPAVRTFVKLAPGTAPDLLAARLRAFAKARYPNPDGGEPIVTFFLRPLDDLHLHPSNPDGSDGADDRLQTLYAVSSTGLAIIILAGVNFVNLLTARATRRALEVGVRKANGALRYQLVIQFIGEALGYSLVGMALGMVLAVFCLPSLNGFLDRTIAFDWWRHPILLVGPILTAFVFGTAAGLYPALMMSSFPPALVVKARSGSIGRSGMLRQILIVLQFTATIALVIATVVIYRQTDFATSQALRFDKQLRLALDLNGTPWKPTPEGLGRREAAPVEVLRSRLGAIPGVQTMAASFNVARMDQFFTLDFRRSGQTEQPIELFMLPVDFDYFSVYGLPILTGRDFSRDFADDKTPTDETSGTADEVPLTAAIINETAVKELGFANASAAIGQEIIGSDPGFPEHRHRIVGVVPDFPLDTIRKKVRGSLFFIDPALFNFLTLKLSGTNLSETLRGIDAVWRDSVPERPINRSFVDERIALLYVNDVREGNLFAAFASVAGVIGCLGLVGLSAYTAERRTKEVGIRKALGASAFDIIKLMIWQFIKPVLLANLFAWPIAAFFMRRWLNGFSYRIELDVTPFLAAGGAAIVIAIVTTAYHAVQVSRSRPVTALRYE
jgi:putative ABC transport system permease protein